MKKEEIDKLSLEETFEEIDAIMEKLTDDELPLEDGFDLYKEGMDMLGHCKDVIDRVEKKVIELSAESGEE